MDIISAVKNCIAIIQKIIGVCQSANVNREALAYIQSRSKALIPSLQKLDAGKTSSQAIQNIRKSLCEVQSCVEKLSKRGKMAKLFLASRDSQTLKELNDKLTQCEADLNLELNTENKIKLDDIYRQMQKQDQYINRLLQDIKSISLNEIQGNADLIVQQLANVFKKDTQEVLQFWHQKQEDIVNNLIANLDAKLQQISEQISQVSNIIQSEFGKMASHCKNEEAKQFVIAYYSNNFSLPWTSFYAALVHGCFQKKNLQDSPQLREQLKLIVDKNGDDSIDISEIDQFFTNVWNNPQKMNQLKQISNQQTQQPQQYYQTKTEIEEDSIIELNLESLKQCLFFISQSTEPSSPKAINNILCSKGHPTKRIFMFSHYANTHGIGSFWGGCDKCNQILSKVGFSFHCCKCDWDLCDECAGIAQICQNNHTLKLLDMQQSNIQ